MREPQHQRDQIRRSASFIELEGASAELIQQLTRFNTEVSVGISRHARLHSVSSIQCLTQQVGAKRGSPEAARYATGHVTDRSARPLSAAFGPNSPRSLSL